MATPTLVTQDMFPGCFLEPKWNRGMVATKAAFYAMRLALGGVVQNNPNGYEQYISIRLHGTKYILHKENYAKAVNVLRHFQNTFLLAKGYPADSADRLAIMPDTVLQAIEHCLISSGKMHEVDYAKTRMLWIIPDLGPCGHYRSIYPSRFSNESFSDIFYSESIETISQGSIDWFDAFIVHRAPTPTMMAAYKNLKAAGKVLVYETDDDLFNVPDFNPCKEAFTPEVLSRASMCIEDADVIIVSTEDLKKKSSKPDVTYVCPNLIDLETLGSPIFPFRQVQQKFFGYKPAFRTKKSMNYYFKGPGRDIERKEITPEDFNPIRIFWGGSTTHAKDLAQIIGPIKRLGDKYGISIRIFFFGYCPTDFLCTSVEEGNTDLKLVVRDEYAHFITFYEFIDYKKYFSLVRDISPDISLAPICEHEFNECKSNLKVIEIGAIGVPTVASNFGPYKFINHGVDGFLASTEDEWFDCIDRLISNIDLRIEMSRNIEKRVREEFSWDNKSENRDKWETAIRKIHEISSNRKSEMPEIVIE